MERKLQARAKINLGLDVLRRRPDGYHDLRMVMQTVNLCDEISLRVLENEPGIRLIVRSGEFVEVSDMANLRGSADSSVHIESLVPADSRNLAYRAAQLLMEEFENRQGLEIILEKRIPVAAGLAGGSSDAAAVLIGTNELFELGLSKEELMERGVKLGADIPYCILRGTALAEGIGERLTPLPQAPEAFVLLAKPPVAVSTKYVYTHLDMEAFSCSSLTADDADRSEDVSVSEGLMKTASVGITHPDIDAQVRAIREGDLYRMAALMGNVLESVTVPGYPVIGEIKKQMMQLGAVNAMMSGSGPTVFGLFDDRGRAENAYEELCRGTLANEVFLTTFF
ncbi:MAG: 4-(cytidine 5'-diphospho)-2-C-methyl-D-erythritol kinase [Lachnospiraceae bacterium]|nr:4-(cytidine 5'-diphospho)-2-C-methyl-D-erythritol kinase [Lachnospiraceae bacterium]